MQPWRRRPPRGILSVGGRTAWTAVARKEVRAVEVARWMKKPVLTVKPLDSLAHAREVMATHRVNQLPVVVDGRLLGIITDRDVREASPSVFDELRDRRPAGTADPQHITVEQVMSRDVLTVAPTTSIVEAARVMRRERIGAVPIVQRDVLVGILTRSDLLDAFVALAEQTGF